MILLFKNITFDFVSVYTFIIHKVTKYEHIKPSTGNIVLMIDMLQFIGIPFRSIMLIAMLSNGINITCIELDCDPKTSTVPYLIP